MELRKKEGAIIVEMEQAGCIAVALYRKIKYGALIYCGDAITDNVWNGRFNQDRSKIRYDLVEMCRTIIKKI